LLSSSYVFAITESAAAMLIVQLEGLLEVARTGNVTRAAEALGITQSALSARMRSLETELGSPLITRTSHGVRLTPAAHSLLPYARRVVDTIANARVAVIGLAPAARLALGAAPAVSTYVLPAILKRFRALHPDVRASVRTGHSEEVLEMVLTDEVEIGLIRSIRHRNVESHMLFDDELVLVARPEHRFARTGRIGLAEIAAEQLIMFDRESSYTEQTSALFRDAGIVLRDVMELDNIDAAKKMVEQGLGIALLPGSAVRDELRSGALRAVEISGTRPIRHRMVAIRRRSADPPSEWARAFLRLLAQERAVSAGSGRTAARRG